MTDWYEEIELDPTQLLPGDLVVRLGEHEESGCHCDVRVTVRRYAVAAGGAQARFALEHEGSKMTLKVRIRFKDGSEVTRDFPGLSWETPGNQALFSGSIREAEAAKGEDHDGAWMEHVTEEA